MSDKMEVYYFSPTGGTKKVSDIFAAAIGKEVIWHDFILPFLDFDII